MDTTVNPGHIITRRPSSLATAIAIGLVPAIFVVADYVLLADPQRGVESMAPGVAIIIAGFLYPGWIGFVGGMTGHPRLPWVLALLPAMLLGPAFLTGTGLPTFRQSTEVDLLAVLIGRVVPLLGVTVMTMLGARATSRRLSASARHDMNMAFFSSLPYAALGVAIGLAPVLA